MPNPFSRSNRAQMGSSYLTDINQGGGDKKAGFPYLIGRDSWTSIYFDAVDPVNGHCCKLKNWNTTVFPLARQSRPIGSSYRSNYRYNHIPGTM